MAPLKSANFVDAEVEQIARSWLLISNNAIVGAGQKSDTFWTSIQNHFNRTMEQFRRQYPGVVTGSHRSLRSLQSKWGDINHDCAKFSGAFSQVDALNESGTTYEQMIEKAKAVYQQMHKKGEEFKMLGCWELLKESPKWHIASRIQERASKKRQKASTDDAAKDTIENAPDLEAESPPTEKRTGNKKAKEIASAEKRGLKGREGLADATEKIVAALNRRAESMEEVAENQIFFTDIDKLDPQARTFLLRKREFANMRLQEKEDLLLTRRNAFFESHRPVSTPLAPLVANPVAASESAAVAEEDASDSDDQVPESGTVSPLPASRENCNSVGDSQVGPLSFLDTQELYRWV